MNPAAAGGFSGTVGALFSAQYPGQDAYAIWKSQGGNPDCSDTGHGAHPETYLTCSGTVKGPNQSAAPTTNAPNQQAGATAQKVVAWLGENPLGGLPNYLWVGAATALALVMKSRR